MFEKEKTEEILNGLITRRAAVEKQLSQYPEVELKVRRQTKNGKEYTTFYLEMPKEPGKVRRERKTISRDTERLRIMARKQYLQTLLERLDGNIAALQETIGMLENTSTGPSSPHWILSSKRRSFFKNKPNIGCRKTRKRQGNT